MRKLAEPFWQYGGSIRHNLGGRHDLLTIPPDLRKAHRALDLGGGFIRKDITRNGSGLSFVARYEQMTAALGLAVQKPKRVKKE